MSKRDKELERLAKRQDKDLDKKLFNYYKETLKELKKEIKHYTDDYENLSFSKQMQVDRKVQVANRVNEIIGELGGDVEPNITGFIRDKAIDSYYGALYTIEGQAKTNMDFSMLSENYIDKLVHKNVAGKDFSKRLYQNRNKLAKRVTSDILQGTVQGQGYARIAKNVSEHTEANYKQSLRIARTEGGRVQTETTQRAYEEAEDLGIELMKQWVSSLDDSTRDEHADLDGQTVGIDEMFEIDGYEAEGPRMFGDPAMDINCRCTTITIVNGISPKLRHDNITKEPIEYKNYTEWKRDRL